MPKRKSTEGRAAFEPNEVLAGRVKVNAVELLDLIHRVNPTGHDLPTREAELRYAQKSRLQSLLVRRFGASLTVVPDPDHEGTVSLRYQGQGRDGCHAVISALDEDARAWVQMQLDLGPPTDAPAVPAARPSRPRAPEPPQVDDEDDGDETVPALMRRAETALEAYDYEAARGYLERALGASKGAPEPAEALLSLLVETLGADADALAIEGSLSRAALDRPGPRGLLALAAARTGDEGRALALVRGAGEAQAAAVFAALAAGALAGGDATRAGSHLEQARRADPTHPAIAALSAEVAKARAAERGPLEAELSGLLAAGKDAEVEKRAAALLARWPESDAARRALRAVEDRRRHAEVERLASEADAALAAGDANEARARLAQALAAARGPEREALEQRMRAAVAASRAAREAAEVERVTALLRAPSPREGLLAYLELDEAIRTRIAGPPAVRWIEHTGRGAPHARVDAVLALARATEQLGAGDAEGALATLGPHLAALERVPEAKDLAKAARARVAAERAARATQAALAAKAALAKGDAAEALRLLDEATLRDVPEPERSAAAATRAEVLAQAARAEKIERLAQLRAAGKLFEARRVAEDLEADAADGTQRARWQAERRAIQAAIQRELRVEVDTEPTPIDETSGLLGWNWAFSAQRWLAPDGRSLVMAEGHGRWVAVHVYDLVDRTVRARVSLRAHEPTGTIVVEVTGDTVWLLGVRGPLLGLSLSTWEVQTQRSAAEVLPAGTQVFNIAVPLGDGAAPRFLWIEPYIQNEFIPPRVVDLVQRRPARALSDLARVAVLPGAHEPRVACLRTCAVALHEDRGTAVAGAAVELPETGVAATLHPDGKSLVVVATLRPEPDGPRSFGWLVVPEGGPPGTVHPIEGSNGEGLARIAASAEEGVVAIQFVNRSQEFELLVLGTSADGLVPLYCVPVSRQFVMAQDAGGRRIFGIERPIDRVGATEIGKTPLAPQRWPFPLRAWIDTVLDFAKCIGWEGEGKASLDDLSGRLRTATRSNVATMIRGYQQKPNVDPNEGIFIAAALEASKAFADEARRLLAWIFERFPSHPEVRLQRMNRLAREGRWSEVERLFDPGTDDPGPRGCHLYHLLALAALHAGDTDRARALLADARRLFPDAYCAYESLADLLDPPPETRAPAIDAPSLAQLAEDARAADRRLAQGDPAGALAALSHEQYWIFGDVQLYARMAEAHLQIEPQRTRDRFRKIMALAKFLEVHEVVDPEDRREMPIPEGTWDRARLDALAARARAFLDAV